MKYSITKKVTYWRDGIKMAYPVAVKPKEVFVQQAQAIWGDRYDYTDSVYQGGKKPIEIYCPKHDHHFIVSMAQNHIIKSPKQPATGCPICRVEKRSGKEYGKDWYTQMREEEELHKKELREKELREKEQREKEQREKEKRAEQREAAKRLRAEQREEKLRQYYNEQRRKRVKDFYDKVSALYPGLEFEALDNITKDSHISATCPRHGTIRHTRNYWLSGKGCEYCNGLWFQPDWEKYARQIHGDKYKYLSAPNIKTDVIKIKCPFHGIFLQRYNVHVDQQCGCPECAGSNVLSKEKRKENFLKKAHEKFGDRFSYAIDEYVNNDTPMSITCKAHNYTFRSTPDTHLRKSGGCPVCGMTSGEARIFTWLRQQGINHHYQYFIPNKNKNLDLQYLVADFYLPAQNMVIEFNGQQHYTDVPYFHRDKDRTIEKQMMRDQTLRDYCTKHGIQLLEIKYDEETMIPEILAKKVSP